MTIQQQLNENVQERLRDLEVQQQVITAFLCSAIETHAELKNKFSITLDYLIGSTVHQPLPESWFEQLNLHRGVLDKFLDRCIAEKVNRS